MGRHTLAGDSTSRNRGTVLILALVFTLALAIVATTVMQTSLMQWQMAGNNQFQLEAFLSAQAIVTELSADEGNFELSGGVGDTNCPVADADVECDRRDLSTPPSAAVGVGSGARFRIVRQDPLLATGFPLRESQDKASSSSSFDAATYEVSAQIDNREQRLGNAHLVQGVALRVPAIP